MKHTRGSTLVETMMAGAVLILGLVGVIQLMVSGMMQFGRANASATSQAVGSASIAEAKALPFAAVTAGVSDAGTVVVDGRRYSRVRTVTDMPFDGGIRWRQVTVVTSWTENLGTINRPRTATVNAIISQTPAEAADGG